MPDLSLESVHVFWYDYDKKTLYSLNELFIQKDL